MRLNLRINGQDHAVEIAASDILLEVLRREGYKGVKKGCGQGECGACTVLLNGRPVNSCLVLAADAEGLEITTIEGIGTPAAPHPIQKALVQAGAVQCGYCTPGMVLSAKALLDRNPDPTEEEIKNALDGNFCRCTGYVKIIKGIGAAAAEIRSRKAVSRGR